MSDEERLVEELADLNRELEPPAVLEDRIVGQLTTDGLLGGADEGAAPRARPTWPVALAASVVLVVAGFLAGRLTIPPPRADPSSTAADEQPSFLLLLYEDEAALQQADDAVADQLFQEYAAWAGQLAEAGHLLSAEPLAADGRLLRTDDGEILQVPGLQPAGQVPSGYFLIRARDVDEATRLARECPHLRHDGTVAVRPVGY